MVPILLAAGAMVNSTGTPDGPHYFPPLWLLCDAPLPVLQLLLDNGADAAWEHDGVSIVEFLRQHRMGSRDLDCNVDLLAWHGARVPKGEEAIMLWQAPVWESWTGGEGQLEDKVPEEVIERTPRGEIVEVYTEYHGWEFVINGTWDQWGPTWRDQELDAGCMCPVCPLWKTGGYRAVRAMVGWGAAGLGYARLYQPPVVSQEVES